MSDQNKLCYKVLVLGDPNVGKTALVNRYVNRHFTSFIATVGVNFSSKDIMLNESNVTFQIWDMAGQERFQNLNSSFFLGADCCVFVFDVSDRETFTSLDSWMEDILAKTNNQYMPFVVFGNKVDLSCREVPMKEALDWCKKRNIPYFETSAKDGRSVDQGFETIVKKVGEKQSERLIDEELSKSFVHLDIECPSESPRSVWEQYCCWCK